MKRIIAFMCAAIVITGCTNETIQPSDNSSSDIQSSQQSSQPNISKPETSSETSSSEASSSAAPAVDTSAPVPNTPQFSLEKIAAERASKSAYMSTLAAKQNWAKAYESFYSAYDRIEGLELEFFQDVRLREKFVYPFYETDTMDCESMLAFAQELTLPSFNADVLNKHIMSPPLRVGVLLNDKSGNFFGEGEVEIIAPAKTPEGEKQKVIMHQSTQYAVGQYNYRTSLTITEGVENQLLERGFSPLTTTAFSLRINFYSHGVCFVDGSKMAFFSNSDTIFTSNVMRPGVVYDFSEIGQDMQQRIDEIFPEPEEIVDFGNPVTRKPVIYLYPTAETDVKVELGYPKEMLTFTYPSYNNGWNVTAYPDGRLINKADNSEHFYLFWEGDKKIEWDLTKGFIVSGADSEKFLLEKLSYMGLTPREYNDFIVYWVPELAKNEYNLISFSTKQYEELAPMDITPKPDSVLRVHMVYKAVEAPYNIEPQDLSQFERNGFTVVEWGGTMA